LTRSRAGNQRRRRERPDLPVLRGIKFR